MPKRNILPVEGERITLRLLEKEDLPLTLSWRNQDHIRTWFNNTDMIAIADHYAWFENYQELDNDFVFVILAHDLDNIRIGQISIYGIDWSTGIAEFGRLIIGDPLAKGKNYAKEATLLLLENSFKQMGLKEIHLEVKEKNEPAIAVYKATGFIERKKDNGIILMTIGNEN